MDRNERWQPGGVTLGRLFGDVPLQVGSLLAAFALVTLYDTYLTWREYMRPAVDLYRQMIDALGLVVPPWVPFVVVETAIPVTLIAGSFLRARAVARKERRRLGIHGDGYRNAALKMDLTLMVAAAAILSVMVLLWQMALRSMVAARRAEIVAIEGEAAADAIMAEHTLGVLGEMQMNHRLAEIETFGLVAILTVIAIASLAEAYLRRDNPAALVHAKARLFSVLLIFIYAGAVLILCTRILGV